MNVLIVTGGLVSGVEASILSSLRKLFEQWRASEHAWLDVKIKLVFGEFLIRKPRASSRSATTSRAISFGRCTRVSTAG